MQYLSQRRKLFLVFVIVLFGAIFLVSSLFTSDMKTISIVIENHKMIKPVSPIIIEKNKQVQLRIQSDVEEDFHLEGYHVFSKLKVDKTMILEFEALTAGTFPIYLDRSHTYLGVITVVE